MPEAWPPTMTCLVSNWWSEHPERLLSIAPLSGTHIKGVVLKLRCSRITWRTEDSWAPPSECQTQHGGAVIFTSDKSPGGTASAAWSGDLTFRITALRHLVIRKWQMSYLTYSLAHFVISMILGDKYFNHFSKRKKLSNNNKDLNLCPGCFSCTHTPIKNSIFF